MSGSVLARQDRALTPDEQAALLRERLGDDAVLRVTDAHGTVTVHVAPERWHDAVERCRDEEQLAYDMFDSLFGIDAREDGFEIVVVLYATTIGTRIALRTLCPGGREAPALASVSGLFRGADWSEREAWDMFGIEFEGHPGLAPRILTVENFEGWPLRKDFHLASRVAKPWPGVKEPAELDEDGNVIEREPRLGDAPGPYDLDKAMAEQAQVRNPLPPATVSGEVAAADAQEADVADESGNVLSGEVEHHAEAAEDQASEVLVEEAGVEARDAAAEAAAKADDRRKAQAEARARKAAERAGEADAEADDEAPSEDGEEPQ